MVARRSQRLSLDHQLCSSLVEGRVVRQMFGSKRGALLGISVLDWAGLLFFALSAVILFIAFVPPAEPTVDVRITSASARFGLQANLLGLLRGEVSGVSFAEMMVKDPVSVSGEVTKHMQALYPDSAWFVRVYPSSVADPAARLEFADLHDGKSFVDVASKTRVDVQEGSRVGCADLEVDVLLADQAKLVALSPLALAEIVVPSGDTVVRVIACEVRLR